MLTGDDAPVLAPLAPAKPDWGIQYHSPLRIEFPADDAHLAELTEPFVIFDSRTGTRFTVPVGFRFDGASIPRAFWWAIGNPMQGRYRRAACLHDWECTQRAVVTPTSAIAHERFYRSMRADGVGYLRAKSMLRAVRAFGPRW